MRFVAIPLISYILLNISIIFLFISVYLLNRKVKELINPKRKPKHMKLYEGDKRGN